jgi:S-(hydroxymethyl)mycothiol dehydrogenase
MAQQVRGVVATAKGAPVTVETITVPDPGPGEALVAVRACGVCHTDLPLIDLFGRGGAVKSSWYGDCLPSRDFPVLIDLYLSGRFDLDGFVSETISLDDVEEAFQKMERGEVLRSVVVL